MFRVSRFASHGCREFALKGCGVQQKPWISAKGGVVTYESGYKLPRGSCLGMEQRGRLYGAVAGFSGAPANKMKRNLLQFFGLT